MKFEKFIGRIRYFFFDDQKIKIRAGVGFPTSIGAEQNDLDGGIGRRRDLVGGFL